MFDEVSVIPGKPYVHGDWKAYAIHDDKNVKGFFGDYRWLSNFHVAPVEFDGYIYPSVENAYQAAKIVPSDRLKLRTCTAYESKKRWKELVKITESAADWDERKFNIMSRLVFQKFLHEDLRKKLIATEEKYLEESNHWSDVYWGVDIRKGGQNRLGEILTNVRTFWNMKGWTG